MKQQTLAAIANQGAGFEQHRRATKRDVFLATMNEIVPWQALCEVIEPHYPKPGNGRPPVGLERMLRMYFVQHWFNLADQACEEALLDSAALRSFVGINLGTRAGRRRSGTRRQRLRAPIRPGCRRSIRASGCGCEAPAHGQRESPDPSASVDYIHTYRSRQDFAPEPIIYLT